ncbi:unnamed protein product [Rotaria socialis]|uniref:Uncharacterized protein n=1 Tax=Rotaria socialis TaxID=392032 RepID=A0A817MVW4_9BILA|nr:unnamed protein product [Rotaria socialis]CAF3376574.1 unnamed protein product [Rotaria socialis]CAF3572634.1 unnamed protein product [Rotaria socialis]
MTTTSATSTAQTPRVRIRTLTVCEPSYPSRDIVRQQNYARRKAQQAQGWCCPRTVSYQGIDPIHLPTESLKPITMERISNAPPLETPARTTNNENGLNRPKSGSVGQEELSMKTQFETTIRRLHTAQQKHMKKSSEILKGVQLGQSIKDVVGKFPRATSTRVETGDSHHGAPSTNSDDKESEILYDRLLDDFEEEDEADVSSRISFVPMKLCQSAPPLNRNNLRQATLRPFTPRYSGLSARLRITRHMPFRDALYRQLCCILWLLRAMARSDWSEMISGCWNIDQWLRNDARQHVHNYHHQQTKKQHEPIKPHPSKTIPLISTTNVTKENPLVSLRAAATNSDTSRKQHLSVESSVTRFPEITPDDQHASRSRLSDTSERLDIPLNSANMDSDFNESSSSRSNPGDAVDSANFESSHQTINIRSTAATPAIFLTNTSRTSTSTNFGQSTGRGMRGRLTSIHERKRSPDILLKRWLKNQKLIVKKSEEALPLTAAQIRLLRVGDNDDLKKIFGLENATDINKEQVKVHRTRETEQKLVANVKRRPTTCVGTGQSKRHAQILNKIKRDFNDFTEEQSIILNNKLEQADNDRLFYCQTKLRELQQKMPPLTILDRLLKHLRFDEDKKKIDAAYLKYQTWYVDLIQMIQPDYADDHIIILLLKEMEEYANPSDKPTVIRLKAVLSDLRPHEICHPDIMAAIEFLRIHVVKMTNEEFDKFFCKQFPTVTKYIMIQDETTDSDDTKLEIQSAL